MPQGNLTPAQHEIMEVVWERGKAGATVVEIWREIAATRPVIRTTVLNLVDRLEKRGWLVRRQTGGVYHYAASMSRDKTAVRLAGEFVDDFFGGSATNLVMSLLGSKRLTPGDIERLRRLLKSSSPKRDDRKGSQP